MTPSRSRYRLCFTLLAWLLPLGASAQTPPAAERLAVALFQTSVDDPSLHELATALDPVLAAELDHVGSVQVFAHPSLDLNAMQLAVDCVSETAECLRMVNDQTHAEGLVAATLRKTETGNTLTLFYFDGRNAGSMKGVTRKHAGNNVEQDTLDDIPAMLDELFGLNQKPAEPAPATTEPAPQSATQSDIETTEPVEKSPLPIGPIVLGSGGIVFLTAGIGFGLAANHSEDAYGKLPTKTKPQIDEADKELKSAKTQALLSNIGFGVGAAAIVGSVVWLILSSSKDGDDSEHAQLVPLITRKEFGLTLRGRFAGSM